MSSNIKCPPKNGGGKENEKSQGYRVKIGFPTKQTEHGDTMGRTQLTREAHCRGSHFTWDERLRLQYHYTGSKERSPTVLEKNFQKSPKTIRRELGRRMVEHVLGELPFILIEYNALHAQNDAMEKMEGKGLPPKSGKHHALVRRISSLILEEHYSPYAVLVQLDKERA